MKFAINRTCAPGLSLPDFIALAVKVGVQGVEIRGDIEGREFADGTPASEVRARLLDAGLQVASVNALQRFNDWTPARAEEARRLVAYAAELGAPGLVLCPVHVPEGWDQPRAEAQLREGLGGLAPILTEHGVTGYVEPLGMTHSTMKRQAMAVAAMEDVGGPYELCFDTFQFFRCGDDRLFPGQIGLAHMSGITAPGEPGALVEPQRGLIFPGDRVGNIAQLQALKAAGYQGWVSMEPFDPAVQSDPDLAQHLRASLDWVAALLA